MPSNATELMRMMVVRAPEPHDGPVIALDPSPKLRDAVGGKPYDAAREILAKFGAAPKNILGDPGEVEGAAALRALRERAGDADDPETLVKAVFGIGAADLVAQGDWAATRGKLADTILVLKLGYRGGSRPLAALADLVRSMAAVEYAAERGTAMDRFRDLLAAPLRFPPPFARDGEEGHKGRKGVRESRAIERATERLVTMVDRHQQVAAIKAAVAELQRIPIDRKNFVVTMGRPNLGLTRIDVATAKIGDEDQAAATERALVAKWATAAGQTGIGSEEPELRLSHDAVAGLSQTTAALLKSQGVDPTAQSIEDVVGSLARVLADATAAVEGLTPQAASKGFGYVGGIRTAATIRPGADHGPAPIALPDGLTIPHDLTIAWSDLLVEAGWPGQPPVVQPEADLGPSRLLPAGVGQLYVIKQHITGYRSGEVSHVENILVGETRERTHRRLDQQEDVTTSEAVVESESEKSQQTTTRAELEREVQETIKRQFDYGASAQVSGSYGPVQFTAAGQVHGSTATETATKTAQKLASEVVETSRQRVMERVRTEKTRRVLNEIEETNLQKFDGASFIEPKVGVYQWIDKVYSNEVWSYGNRTLYEVVVPEPGAALIAAATAPAADTPHLVDKPVALDVDVATLDQAKVAQLVAGYGVTEPIELYPQPILINLAFSQSSDANASDNFYAETKDIDVPDGYELLDGYITVRARGENQRPKIGVIIGTATERFVTQNIIADELPYGPTKILFTADASRATVATLQAAIAVDDYSAFAVGVTVRLQPSAALLNRWRRTAFAAIRGAYDVKLAEWRDYQSRTEFEKPEISEILFGRNPSASREMARQELQRGAAEIFRNKSFDLDLIREPGGTDPMPRIDFASVAEDSPEILFLSQAFEWENLTFILYPYFFGRRSDWPQKMLFASSDLNLVEFLKAGAARVQVPVRPGFEAAVDHYMMTREPYFGNGMPQIGDALYIPYIDEARDSFGAALGGTHHPEMDFEVAVPTELVVARNGAKINTDGTTLPAWAKNGEQWVET